MADWRGKHVMVVGGSSGIGLASAEAFAARGADVTIVARSRDRLEAACEAVKLRRADTSQRVRWVSADASTPDGAAEAVVKATEAGTWPVDVLVSCAGVIIPGYFESMRVEDFEECMDSWRACVHGARAVAPSMMERRTGHIVNVSSMAGLMGLFGYTAYSSAKYAIVGLSEALRSEMKPYGVRVSVVCPPDTDTPGLAFEKGLRPPETDKVAGAVAPILPSVVADALVRGVEKGRFLIVPGALSKFYRVLKANALWLFFAITDSDVASARKARGV
ncbi:MAG: SDR family oxidoreductase [Coriobacteriia bacterium]|nr:SDR family oxidoreductase [Coriobacteriia bacterium]